MNGKTLSSRGPAIGFIETSSIARGIEATDAMLKMAGVELLMTTIVPRGNDCRHQQFHSRHLQHGIGGFNSPGNRARFDEAYCRTSRGKRLAVHRLVGVPLGSSEANCPTWAINWRN